MAKTNILCDNFGKFASSFNYEYTDEKGLTQSVVITNSQLMYSEDKGNVTFVGSYLAPDAINFSVCKSNDGIWSGGYAISYINPYSKVVQSDYSV